MKYCVINCLNETTVSEWRHLIEFHASNSSTMLVLDENTSVAELETSRIVKIREPNMINQHKLILNDASCAVLSLTKDWNASTVPFLPEFKKQIVLPILEIIQAQSTADMIIFDRSVNQLRAKVLLLIDICTSLHSSIINKNIDEDNDDDKVTHTITPSADYRSEVVEVSSRPNWHLYESTISGDKMVKFEVIKDQVSSYIHQCICELEWTEHISEEFVDFIVRVVCAILRERRIPRDIRSLPDSIRKVMNNESSNDGTTVDDILTMFSNVDNNTTGGVKSLPTAEEGLSVFEYFSGIGGMRLGLPEAVRGIPIRNVVAYDVSNVANEVYQHNFEPTSINSSSSSSASKNILDTKGGKLKRVSIDGLKLHEVDGKADIWTMSPPCQPYTTTKGANRQDQLDNRSRGIFHLMELLLHMSQLPRWIVLENVRGFLDSNVLQLWKQVIRKCGYKYKQYLLSPEDCVGLPNSRRRYYFIAEHSSSVDSPFLQQFTNVNESEDTTMNKKIKLSHDNRVINENSDINRTIIGKDGEIVHTILPSNVAQYYPTTACTIQEVLSRRPVDSSQTTCHCSMEELSALHLSDRVLSANWSNLLSIIGPHDKRSYCFTKGYGKLFDRSTGSCYYPDAMGPLSDPQYELNKSELMPLKGKLRLFDPSEILLLSGFPVEFSWPISMPLQHRWGCIGNSVNVTVVKAVMMCLFGNE